MRRDCQLVSLQLVRVVSQRMTTAVLADVLDLLVFSSVTVFAGFAGNKKAGYDHPVVSECGLAGFLMALLHSGLTGRSLSHRYG